MADGYYLDPAVWADRVAFVAEDDLWTVPLAGGAARRMTALRRAPRLPRFTPDGGTIVFAAREEGPEDVYAMPAAGGEVRRLTFMGGASPAGFLPDGRLAVVSGARSAHGLPHLFAVSLDGGEPQALGYGFATSIAFDQGGAVALARRNFREYAHWKRYRGGTAGQIWVDAEGGGRFRRVTGLAGDQEWPMWLGGRLYFLSAHEGVGNLYSSAPDGSDVRRATDHVEYFARNASTDGRHVVYHAGADLFAFAPGDDGPRRIEVAWSGPAAARARRFVPADRHLTHYALHPNGHSLALTTRGKPFLMGNWEGPVVQGGEPQGVHYKRAAYLPDGRHWAVVSDADGEDGIEVHDADGAAPPRRLAAGELGHVYELALSPKGDAAAVTNQRMELVLVDLESGRARVADRSENGRIEDVAWSADGRYVAYSFADSRRTKAIRILDTRGGAPVTVTRPVLHDYAPCFDPKGRYLYFLSARVYDPIYDALQFAMAFPRGTRPYLITLKADTEDPFLARPRPLADAPEAGGEQAADAGAGKGKEKSAPDVEIDFDGIQDRIVAFPVPEGKYVQLGAVDGRVLYICVPVEGELSHGMLDDVRKGELGAYDLKDLAAETVATGVRDFTLSGDGSTLAYRAGDRLRVVRSAEKEEGGGKAGGGGGEGAEAGRKSGWVDLDRVKVSVEPAAEWREMLAESWRNMRDHFWTADMSGVDWQAMYERYRALLPRVATRAELFDVIWEMQGELGTSHAYVWSGDPGEGPRYPGGSLAAEFSWDAAAGGYRIVRIVRGDTWTEDEDSPLRAPGVNVREGDVVLAVNGRRLNPALTPEAALVNLAGAEVRLTVAGRGAGAERAVTVRALKGEDRARYREWVDRNRSYVHEATGGRVGYVHVPDMMAAGYAEFHRGFLAESQRDALIVDVRFNGGGHVSPLIIERLRRRVIGYDVPRWGQPESYPNEAVTGPLVCLTNEHAGSDGDIFSQAFKTYGLGPLIGTRTWGGVIGISGERALVDGTITTQPEFSFWFDGAGWGVENYGVDPDIVVEDPPLDEGRGKDAQLDRSVAESLRLLAERPAAAPAFGPRPRLVIPTSLPPR